MNKSTCEIICLQFAPWEKLRPCLWMFKGLEHFQRQCELLKQEARQTQGLFALRGFVWAANQTVSSTKRTAFRMVSREVVCPIISGRSWTSGTYKLPKDSHTHTQFYAAAKYTQVTVCDWKEQLGFQTNSNLVLNFAETERSLLPLPPVKAKVLSQISLCYITKFSLVSFICGIVEWNAWFKLEMERKNWHWDDAGNGTRVGMSAWISGRVLLWRPGRGDGRCQA